MADDRTNVRVRKLQGRENFDEWKRAAKSYLIIKNLWSVIAGPHTPQDSLYNYIKETTSAKEVWDGICAAFDDSGTARKVSVMNQLTSAKLSRHGSMEKYVNEVLLLSNKCKVAGFKIGEDIIASIMLGGLPEEYRAMVLGIENSARELTIDYVKTVLLQGIPDPLSRGEREHVDTVPALAARKTETRRKCFTCDSEFHLKINCPKNRKRACFECGSTLHLIKECPGKCEKGLVVL